MAVGIEGSNRILEIFRDRKEGEEGLEKLGIFEFVERCSLMTKGIHRACVLVFLLSMNFNKVTSDF